MASQDDEIEIIAKPSAEDEIEVVAKPSQGNWYQAALNGLTFGLRPRIQAAIESGSLSGPEYEKVKKREWSEDDAYAKENPWTAFGLEMAGSVPTMFVPGLNAARLAQAANRGNQAVQGLSRGQRVARAAGFGREVGTIGHEAGMLGAKGAALYGGLSSREDTAGGRLTDAAMHAPLGYALGRGTQAIGGRLAGVGEEAYDAARVGGDATRGALTGIRRGLERDGVGVDDIRNAVSAQFGRGNVADRGALENAMIHYGDTLAGGATDHAARQAAAQNYVAAMRATGSNASESTLRGHFNRTFDNWTGQGNIPLALDEVARLSGGSNENLQWTRRAAQASPNAGRSAVVQGVRDRQDDIIPAVREFVNDRIGNPNLEDAHEALIRANRQAENRIYDAARAAEKPFDLSSVLEEIYRTQPFRGGAGREAVEQAMQIMRGNPLPDGSFERHTLDTYIQSRPQLRDLIDNYSRDVGMGRLQPTTASRFLTDMMHRLDAVAERSNPLWRVANDATRGGRSVEQAMREAANISLEGRGRETRQLLNRVRDLRATAAQLRRSGADPARLELIENQLEGYRVGFSSVLHTALDRLGDSHDFSKLFRKGGRDAQSGVRRVIETMLGPDDAADFYNLVERANIATKTFRDLSQSQTTPLREAIDEAKGESRVAGMMQALGYWSNPRQIFNDLGEMLSNRLFENRNTELMRRYSTMTDDPAGFLRLLREIDQFGAQRGGAFTGERVNAYSAPGVVGGAFASSQALEDERKRQR